MSRIVPGFLFMDRLKVEWLMKSIFKSTIVNAVLVLIGATLLTGCNTVKGFGQDMQEGGKQLQQEAEKSQNN